jgi:hypothetical protein
MGCSAPISLISSVCLDLPAWLSWQSTPSTPATPHRACTPNPHPRKRSQDLPRPTAKKEEKKKKREDRTEPTELSASERSKIAVANASRESQVHGRLTAQPTNPPIHHTPLGPLPAAKENRARCSDSPTNRQSHSSVPQIASAKVNATHSTPGSSVDNAHGGRSLFSFSLPSPRFWRSSSSHPSH